MKTRIIMITFLIGLILITLPVNAEKITPISYEWHESVEVDGDHDAGNAFDGSTTSYAKSVGVGGAIHVVFPGGSNITEVHIRPGGWQSYWSMTSEPWRLGFTYYDWQSIGSDVWTNTTLPTNQWCTNGSLWVFSDRGGWPFWLTEIEFYGTGAPPGNPDFTGYPLDGYNPLEVSFTIQNSTGMNETGAQFSFGDGQIATTTTSTINHTYQNPGIYTVSMMYYNASGVQTTVTKNNYILASIPTGMIVNLDVKNAITGALIQDSTVGIQNTTTGVWRNTTAPTGLVYFSTTDPGYLYSLSQNQSITLAANKTGYKPASETFNIPYNNYRARLFLMPTTITNATGAGTVVVNVVRNKDGLTVSGMSVVIDSGQMGSTNSAGAVTLFNVTAGNRVVKVTDPWDAYQTTEKSFTLAEGDTELVVVQVVLAGESPIDTPGSPVPTATGTYDPDDPNSPVYGNYSTTEINEQGGAGVLGMLRQLIALWPIIVLGIFMKFIKSAFT